jgi:hypothetical protein
MGNGFVARNFQGAADRARGMYDLFCHAKILACEFAVRQELPARKVSREWRIAFILLLKQKDMSSAAARNIISKWI